MKGRVTVTVTLALAAGALLTMLSIRALAREEKIPKNILTKKNPVASSDAVLSAARSNYQDNCLPCHGAKGKGDGPMASMLKARPADLSSPANLTGMTDGEIFWRITKGKDPMPPFETKLTDTERWGLVNLLRNMSGTKPNTTPRTK